MGLDVYLYHSLNRDKEREIEQEYEEKAEALWGGRSYLDVPQDERDAISAQSKALATEMGLSEYGGSRSAKNIELPSTTEPDHLFKIGYFRSSYNSNGFNSVLGDRGLPDLYSIFEPKDDEEDGEVLPDWRAAKIRAEELVRRLEEEVGSARGQYSIITLDCTRGISAPTSEDEALNIAVQQVATHSDREQGWNDYSNGLGRWMLDGNYTIIGLMPGTREGWRREAEPCVYVAVKHEESPLLWYLNAAKIVVETIDYVLSQPDPENYYFHWSA